MQLLKSELWEGEVLTRNFWRGVIAGGVLAAAMVMLRRPHRKPIDLSGMDMVKCMHPRRAADRVFKGVARRVDGLIKK